MTTPPTEQKLDEITAIAARAADDPFYVSDCEGSLQVWREKALTHVRRDESGEIDMYSFPSTYKVTDQVIELDLSTWDPGEDATDDQQRQDIHDLVESRAAMPMLLDTIRRQRARTAELEVGLHDLAALVSQWHGRATKAEARVAELERPAATPDTLPAWLSQRFDPRGPYWEDLTEDDRSYWEHHARAVRRAVDRGGFKAVALDAASAPSGAPVRGAQPSSVSESAQSPTGTPEEAPRDSGELEPESPLPDRLEAALTQRFTELGNPYSRMRITFQGPDDWPASKEVGPRHVAEVLRELLAATTEDPVPADDFTGTQPCGHDDYHDPHPWHGRPDLWCPGIGYDDDAAEEQQ